MTPLRRVVAAGTGVLLVTLVALSLRYGGSAALSDAGALRAQWVVSEWRAQRGPAFSPELWLQTRDSLNRAAATTPDNAHLFDDLGFMHAARAQGMGDPEPNSAAWVYKQTLLVQSIGSYRAATRLRPTFPYSWVYLALAKHQMGEQDPEFWLAFDKALRFGRHEAGVQPALAEMAFAHWRALGAQRQQLVDEMVATAQPAQRHRLMEQAARSGVVLPKAAALPTNAAL